MTPGLWIRKQICRAWCSLTGAHAVWVKDRDDGIITVKVMRTRFDPFVEEQEKVVRFRRYGVRKCHANGVVGGGSWRWRYVSEDLHVQQKLSN